jgi:hypothetical protein
MDKYSQLKNRKEILTPEEKGYGILVLNEFNGLKEYERYIEDKSLLNKLGLKDLENK